MAGHTNHEAPRTALITGASSGIGAAFADVYAQKGYALVLHAPPWEEATLSVLSNSLTEQYGVRIHILLSDLTDPQAPSQIFDELTALNLQVDILVNSAGFAKYADFQDTDWLQHERFLSIMIQAVCHMTYLFTPNMIERGYGRIINVASIAGLMPGLPSLAFYGAAKAFLIKFSESLAAELALDGVHVTALCPGMTRTGLFAAAGLEKKVSHMAAVFWMDPERVAREGVEAVENNVQVHVNGWINRALVRIANSLPNRLIRHYVVKRERRIRAKAHRQQQAER